MLPLFPGATPAAATMLAEDSPIARGTSLGPEMNVTSWPSSDSCTKYKLPEGSTERCVGRRGKSGVTVARSTAYFGGGGSESLVVTAPRRSHPAASSKMKNEKNPIT